MSATVGRSGGHDPTLYNEDLAPIPREQRNWSWVNYTTVWMGMVHNIVAYETSANLLNQGFSPLQALMVVAVANAVLVAAMWINGLAGTKYGLPFPVLVRAVFGYTGARALVLVRAFVAIFWFAVQTYAGCLAVDAILGVAVPGWSALREISIIGMPLSVAVSFAVFWVLHAYVIGHGMERIKFFELWAGPIVIVLGLGLVVWAVNAAGGVAPLFDQPSKLSGGEFWTAFGLSVTALVGVWATLVLNISDFTRFSRSQRDQMVGQTVGLPGTAVIFAVMSIAITAGTVVAFDRPIVNPVQLLQQFESPVILLVGAGALLIATLSVNVAANVVAPAYDLVNLLPRRLNFVKAGLISIVLGVLFMPWLWFDNSEAIFPVLNVIGGALGPIAGLMIADFFWVRRGNYDLDDFYERGREFEYAHGWNLRAMAALGLSLAVVFSGLVLPALGLPQFAFLYTYSWFIGLAIAARSYMFLMRSSRSEAGAAEPTMGIAEELS